MVKLTSAQIFALRGITVEEAEKHPAYYYTKRTQHINRDGSISNVRDVYFAASDSPTGRLWVASSEIVTKASV